MLIIKTSTKANAGNGVFTTQPIKKGEFVCYYEGYKVPKKPTPLECKYQLGPHIIGFMKPRSALGVAQIINDFAKIDLSLLNEKVSSEEQVQQLLQEVLKYSNSSFHCIVEHNNTIVERKSTITSELVATKDIETGSELFFHYGFKYWLHSDKFSGSLDRYRVVCAVQAILDLARHDNEEALTYCDQKYGIEEVREFHHFYEQILALIASLTKDVSNFLNYTEEIETSFMKREGIMKVDLSKMDRKPGFTKEMIDISYKGFKDELAKQK